MCTLGSQNRNTLTHVHSTTHTTSFSYHLELAHVICKRILCPDGAVENCSCHHPPDVATYPTECREGHLFITIIIMASLLPASSQVNPPLSSAEHLPNMYTVYSLLLCADVSESHSTGSIHICKTEIKYNTLIVRAVFRYPFILSISLSTILSMCVYCIASFSVYILSIFYTCLWFIFFL